AVHPPRIQRLQRDSSARVPKSSKDPHLRLKKEAGKILGLATVPVAGFPKSGFLRKMPAPGCTLRPFAWRISPVLL
ncbi:MAG: hypothetical protein LW850_04130, partial [Planctomycetaceae bacterium]|nr:hypothetical protein [Planctomycetaceae bacterium]